MNDLIASAIGRAPLDTVIRNVKLVNVYSGEIYEASIGISQGRIACVGDLEGYKATVEIDGEGLYATPGFMDGHLHIESSYVKPSEYCKAVLPHGTTAIFADPHEIANVLGVRGIRLFIEEGKRIPLRLFILVPSCVPAVKGLDSSGAEIGPRDIMELMLDSSVVGLAEVMDFPGVINGKAEVLEKIRVVERMGGVIDGHAPGLLGGRLCAYRCAGIDSDHEATTPEEAIERIRQGFYLMIREGSLTKDLRVLLKPIIERGLDTRKCVFVTDDRNIEELRKKGHMDDLIRIAIEMGLDPVKAIQMATINIAERFGLSKDLGAIAPGKYADIVLLSSLERARVEKVFFNGELVVNNGRLVAKVEGMEYPEYAINTVRLKRMVFPEDFQLRHDGNSEVKVRVIGAMDGSIYTEAFHEELQVVDGIVQPDLERDIIRIAVIERHRGTGEIGLGFVKGFGIEHGAIASTVSHDSHNIVVVGVEDRELAHAVNEVHKMGGGICVVAGGEVKAKMPLPIAGIVSDRPADEVITQIENIKEAANTLGTKLREPFMTLGFLCLPVIPKLKITVKGLVDVLESRVVNPIIEE